MNDILLQYKPEEPLYINRLRTYDPGDEEKVVLSTTVGQEKYLPTPETFYLAYRGSIAHGMFVPPEQPDSTDDIDLMGFVFGRREDYFGLAPKPATEEVKAGPWDVVLYEIRKAFGLLLKGNPNVLSMLWVREQDRIVVKPEAKRLIENRNLFIGKHVYPAFVGYAHAQMQKMELRDAAELREYLAVTAELKYRGIHPNQKSNVAWSSSSEGTQTLRGEQSGEAKNVATWGDEKLITRLRHFQKKDMNLGYLGDKRKQLVLEHGYDCKNAAHLIRLLRMCIEFLETGEMQVWRRDAQQLLQIKRGEWPLDQVKSYAADLFEAAKQAAATSALPEEPDRVKVNALLMAMLSERSTQWLK